MIDQNNFDIKSFEKPWHGQIFAITLSLYENNVFLPTSQHYTLGYLINIPFKTRLKGL